MTSRKRDYTSNWNSSISSWTSNFKIRSSSFSFSVEPAGFFPARVLAAVPAFLVAALDGGLDIIPLLVVDELFVVVLGFCADTRGLIGLTWDVVTLETDCFLGETAFAFALDLTGRAVTAGFATVAGREVVVVRVDAVLVVVVAILTVGADRVGRLVEVETTVPRVLVVAGL